MGIWRKQVYAGDLKSPDFGHGGSSPPIPTKKERGVAQLGSASALGAEGRRFESCHPDQLGEKDEEKNSC